MKPITYLRARFWDAYARRAYRAYERRVSRAKALFAKLGLHHD